MNNLLQDESMKKLAILFLTRAILPLRTKCSGGRPWLSLIWPGTSAISAKRVPATGDFLGFPIAFYIDDAKGMPDYLAAA
jgi:hypothetical protein